MPYDESMAERIRDLLTGVAGLTEKKMFGGIGFMINGNMAAGAHNDGRLMIRAAHDDSVAFATEDGAALMQRGGKGMKGWVLVDSDAVTADGALEHWVGRGRDHAAGLPPKTPKAKR
jgi:TfoX/Sxy family transcriptional regulator of competence genes